MRILSLIFALLVVGYSAVTARGADLTKIDRTIAKEPVCKSPPKYCLLVVGPDAKTRVWLVLDGEVLYVDRNGNGNLTEEGERVNPSKDDWGDPDVPRLYRHFFEVAGLSDADGITRPDALHIQFVGTARQAPHKSACSIDYGRQVAAGVRFAGRADAPILHFAGPLTFRLAQPQSFVPGLEPRPLNGRDPVNWLQVCAGTPGLGRGGAFVYFTGGHDDTRTKNLAAQADIAFPCRDGRTRQIRVELADSCCAPFTFEGAVPIPAEAVSGKAKVAVSFGDGNKERVVPATFEVSIAGTLPPTK